MVVVAVVGTAGRGASGPFRNAPVVVIVGVGRSQLLACGPMLLGLAPGDPCQNVTTAVHHTLAHAEAARPFAAVAPVSKGRRRRVRDFGHLRGREQLVGSVFGHVRPLGASNRSALTRNGCKESLVGLRKAQISPETNARSRVNRRVERRSVSRRRRPRRACFGMVLGVPPGRFPATIARDRLRHLALTREGEAVTPHDIAMRDATRLLERVGLPYPFSVRVFLNQIADQRVKPIVLHRLKPGWCGSADWCGAWLDTGAEDHIFFVQDVSPMKIAQTVLHEVGHVLFDHPGQPVPANVLFGDLPAVAVRRARGRSDFDEFDELAAEAFSTLVLQSTMFRARTDLGVPDDPRQALLEVRLG
jgi:hypothetical protein